MKWEANFKNAQQDAEILKAHLEKSYLKKYDVCALGKAIYKSPSQATRIFKKVYGITPYSYYTTLRTHKAKLLLETTDLSVRQIALALEFGDEHCFSTFFKKQTGISPSQYREAVGGK